MNKSKGLKGENERSKRKNISTAAKNAETSKKSTQRVTSRNVKRSLVETPKFKVNLKGFCDAPKRKKKTSVTDSVKPSSKILGKRKAAEKNPVKRKRRKFEINSDDEGESAVRKSIKRKVETDDDEDARENEERNTDSPDDAGSRSNEPRVSNNKLVLKNAFLLRKLKRESSVHTVQKYETERTDYIKEDRPRESNKIKDYVCHDTLTSSENSPKSYHEIENQSLNMETDEDNESQADSSTKAAKSKNEFSSRPGFNFQVGSRLEARDYLNMWYPSRIIQVDMESKEILIHFERWNSRFDEWVAMDSPRLRPITRTSTRKVVRGRKPVLKNFKVGEIVYAKWTDCKMYPAKVIKVNPDETYIVLFYDGFERIVQHINIKKLPPELVGKVHFAPGAGMKLEEEKHRRPSGSKSIDGSSPDRGPTEEELPAVKAPTKIKEAKRQHLKIKLGGGPSPKTRKNSLEKGTSGRSSPVTNVSKVGGTLEKSDKSFDEKLKAKGSISSPLLVHELSKAPLIDLMGVPTKAFLIEEDHNHFKCNVPGCGKSFRKDVLLASHMKHYHTIKSTGHMKKPTSDTKDDHSEIAIDQPDTSFEASNLETLNVSNTAVEGNIERKMITEKRRQQLMQKKLDSMSKKKDQHISDVIASVAKKYNPASPEKLQPDSPPKDITPKIEKPKPSPKKRRCFFTNKVVSRFRKMKMISGRRVSSLDEGLQQELINCCCDLTEEDGLMMQCEVCLAWQHGACFGIEDEKNVPEKYVCRTCKNPRGLRSSSRYCYNYDWFKLGELASLDCIPQRDNWKARNNVFKTHGLAAHTIFASDVCHSLRYKLQIAKDSTHPELKNWVLPWKRKPLNVSEVDNMENGDKASDGIWGFSDHCYSAPNQEFSSEPLVDQNGLFFNDSSKGLCFEVAANEEVLDISRTTQNTTIDSANETEISSQTIKSSNDLSSENEVPALNSSDSLPNEQKNKPSEIPPTNIKLESEETKPNTEDKDKKCINEEKPATEKVPEVSDDPLRWQLNLLEHVENVQLDLDSRLNDITKLVEVLEGEYQYSEMNIAKDPMSDMSRTKRLLNCLMNDLLKMRRMSLY